MTKLEEYQTDADIAVMDLFGKIWGIGPAQAKRWVDQVFLLDCVGAAMVIVSDFLGLSDAGRSSNQSKTGPQSNDRFEIFQ